MNTKAKENQCHWETYGYQCREEQTHDNLFCEEHAPMKCTVCNEQATHGCPTEFQFVCGASICDNHRFCKECTNRTKNK